MRQQVVREEHGLRMLQVGPAGHRDPEVHLSLRDQSVDDVEHEGTDDTRALAQVHPEQRGDLVVAGPPGAEPAAELGPDPLDQAPLECRVDVLVLDSGHEGAGPHVGREVVQPRQHPGEVSVGKEPSGIQHSRVGTGARDVVGSQPPVEVGALGQGRESLVGPGREAPTPQAEPFGGLRRVSSHRDLLAVRGRSVTGADEALEPGGDRRRLRRRGRDEHDRVIPGERADDGWVAGLVDR